MRFAVKTASIIGLLLPLLETYRRGFGHWRIEFTTMLEDYVAGGLLLVAAWAGFRRQTWARDALVVAWAWVTGMMTISVVSQVEDTLRTGSPEPDNAVVVVVKVLLLLVSASALVSALRWSSRDIDNSTR